MQTLTLKAHADQDGIIRLEIPTQITNQEVEIVVVMQTSASEEAVDAMGYPLGYFEEIDRIVADDMIEREQPYDLDERDELE